MYIKNIGEKNTNDLNKIKYMIKRTDEDDGEIITGKEIDHVVGNHELLKIITDNQLTQNELASKINACIIRYLEIRQICIKTNGKYNKIDAKLLELSNETINVFGKECNKDVIHSIINTVSVWAIIEIYASLTNIANYKGTDDMTSLATFCTMAFIYSKLIDNIFMLIKSIVQYIKSRNK